MNDTDRPQREYDPIVRARQAEARNVLCDYRDRGKVVR